MWFVTVEFVEQWFASRIWLLSLLLPISEAPLPQPRIAGKRQT